MTQERDSNPLYTDNNPQARRTVLDQIGRQSSQLMKTNWGWGILFLVLMYLGFYLILRLFGPPIAGWQLMRFGCLLLMFVGAWWLGKRVQRPKCPRCNSNLPGFSTLWHLRWKNPELYASKNWPDYWYCTFCGLELTKPFETNCDGL